MDHKKYQESNYEVHARDSVEDKLKYMKIEAGLKMSFLSGLIKVEGSASYLDDHKFSKRVARVTVKFHAETHFEQLTMAHLAVDNIHYPNVLDDKEATHVVVGTNTYFKKLLIKYPRIKISLRISQTNSHETTFEKRRHSFVR